MKLKLLAALVAITSLLSGCRETAEFRYKLTLTVDTPDGVKSASTVVNVRKHIIRSLGGGSTITGEALYLDLGPNKRPLIALLTRVPARRVENPPHQKGQWEEDHPTRLLKLLYGIDPQSDDTAVSGARRLAKMRGPKQLNPIDLPELVTFADFKDPLSVMLVDETNPTHALRQNVTWRSITLEVTDEPVTKGILKKLPWLSGKIMSPGETSIDAKNKSLPLGLTARNFIRS
jgi:hypothetical protein